MPDGNERNGAESLHGEDSVSASSLEAWFMREVWPLEAILMQYLRQNWRDQSAAEDLLHDVYVQVYQAASKELPENNASSEKHMILDFTLGKDIGIGLFGTSGTNTIAAGVRSVQFVRNRGS